VLLRDARRVAERLDELRRSIEADGNGTMRALAPSVAAVDWVIRRLAERHAAQRRQLRYARQEPAAR
jgi:DNA-binding transcriptional LysR family regulator